MFIHGPVVRAGKARGRVPVIMNVNGHVGKPGKAVPYKQLRSINQAKRACSP